MTQHPNAPTSAPDAGKVGDPATRRPPNNDVPKDSRIDGAEDTRPSKIEREESGRQDLGRP